MSKICNGGCKHLQPYNENWGICWHNMVKGSKVQINKYCVVDLINTEPQPHKKLKVMK